MNVFLQSLMASSALIHRPIGLWWWCSCGSVTNFSMRSLSLEMSMLIFCESFHLEKFNLMQFHFCIIVKFIDIIGQHTYIIWIDTEFQDRWKRSLGRHNKRWNETVIGLWAQYLSGWRRRNKRRKNILTKL
jgi:hypothetical protein